MGSRYITVQCSADSQPADMLAGDTFTPTSCQEADKVTRQTSCTCLPTRHTREHSVLRLH